MIFDVIQDKPANKFTSFPDFNHMQFLIIQYVNN